jgi:hypothetical protein
MLFRHTTKPEIIGRRSSQLKTFAGIDSTCVSVLSGIIRPIISGFVVDRMDTNLNPEFQVRSWNTKFPTFGNRERKCLHTQKLKRLLTFL